MSAQITVEAYGAIADGKTDNTHAIQTAINSLRQGQKLVFPCLAGNQYLITSPLDFGNVQYASLEGNGPVPEAVFSSMLSSAV